MKVIGWTGWDDPRYPDDYGDDPLLEERKKVVVEELRKHNYHISGYYHQGGKRGVPVFDDGNWLRISFRSWGQIMADAYPEEMAQAKSAYTVWAWCSPCEPKDMITPRRGDYPEYDFWEGPFPVDDMEWHMKCVIFSCLLMHARYESVRPIQTQPRCCSHMLSLFPCSFIYWYSLL